MSIGKTPRSVSALKKSKEEGLSETDKSFMSLGKKVGTSQETHSNDGGGAASERIRDVLKGCRTDRCHMVL